MPKHTQNQKTEKRLSVKKAIIHALQHPDFYCSKHGFTKHDILTYLKVHNKELKLYEDGRIYNIMEDLQEINPLNEEDLTSEQIQIIDGFRRVLQKMQ